VQGSKRGMADSQPHLENLVGDYVVL